MGIHFESEWESTKTNTYYPFKNALNISPGFIRSMIVKNNKRIYVKSISQTSIILYDEDESLFGTCVYSIPGIYKIDNNNGYIEIGERFHKDYIEFSFMESEILPSCISTQEYLNSISNNIFKDGYNFAFLLDGNSIKFNIDRGAGAGEYCGNNIDYNAIYTINSVKPINGNLKWYERGYFRIIPDKENHTLYFNLIVPDELCLRDGYKGEPGPDGPNGSNGSDGLDAVHLVMEFEC